MPINLASLVSHANATASKRSHRTRFSRFSGGIAMEQRFDGTPQAVIRLEGRRAVRGDVTNDWGSRLQWVIRRNGEVIATQNARADMSYEQADATPGTY